VAPWKSQPLRLPDDLADRLLSPVLVIDLDRVRGNVRKMVEHVGGPGRWRPHLKTAKLPEVWAELFAAGVRHFKCATTREAACLLRAAADARVEADLLVAHPLAGANLAVLRDLAADHPGARVSVLCEDATTAATAPGTLGVFVDVNPGMNRTGIAMDQGAEIAAVARAAGARLRGVHCYEGHLNSPDTQARRRDASACYDRLVTLIGALHRDGIEPGEVVTSGTPTVLDAIAHDGLRGLACHRVSPGTVVLHDARSEEVCPQLGLEPAAAVFTRVVSRPAPRIVTCDAGSKSIAAEAGDPCAIAPGWPGLVAMTPSEEHLPLRVTGGDPPPRGTWLGLVPRHVCPTVNLAEQAVLIDVGQVVGIATVEARAHDVLAGALVPGRG